MKQIMTFMMRSGINERVFGRTGRFRTSGLYAVVCVSPTVAGLSLEHIQQAVQERKTDMLKSRRWIRWYRERMLHIGGDWLYFSVGKPCDTVKQHFRIEICIYVFYICWDFGFACGINPLD